MKMIVDILKAITGNEYTWLEIGEAIKAKKDNNEKKYIYWGKNIKKYDEAFLDKETEDIYVKVAEYETIEEVCKYKDFKTVYKELGEKYNKNTREIIKNINIEYLTKEIDKNKEERIEECKNNINRLEQEFEVLKNRIYSIPKAIQNSRVTIDALEKDTFYADKTRKELENIENHAMVEDVDYTEVGSINVYTKDIYCYDENDNRYYIGKMLIKVPLMKDKDTKIFNLNNKRDAYWGEQSNHPHVNEDGRPCLGTAMAMIAEFQANSEYFAIFITLLNYCQSCDIYDIAGASVVAWDRVDEEGNIIEEGHWRDGIECYSCGDIVDEDEAYYCEDCDNQFCVNCITYVESVDRYVCDNCLERYYEKCSVCGEFITKDDVYYVEGEPVCSYCLDDKTRECDVCGEYIFNDNIHEYIDKNGDILYVCDDCLNKMEENDER